MQATQPYRTIHPMQVGITALVAVALLVAALVVGSLLPSIGRSTAPGSNAGSGFVPVRHDFYGAPAQAPLKLDPDARRGGRGIQVSVPE